MDFVKWENSYLGSSKLWRKERKLRRIRTCPSWAMVYFLPAGVEVSADSLWSWWKPLWLRCSTHCLMTTMWMWPGWVKTCRLSVQIAPESNYMTNIYSIHYAGANQAARLCRCISPVCLLAEETAFPSLFCFSCFSIQDCAILKLFLSLYADYPSFLSGPVCRKY